MNIWKLGCNWGTGQPFFDDFLRTENIVLGWTNHNYAIDDIVLIAKGHTIIAITRVIGNRAPLTSKKEYEEPCDKYNIEYCEQVHFTKVNWIDLKNEDYFQYELQQGICQVRSTDIQNKAISLFEKYNFANKLKNNQLFTLRQIADWQLKLNEKKVELPPLQRGFVWKAKQIEDLWDSLLRGFPIGSFLLSDDEKENYFLMDGQQRATAITLGFYNPWEKAEVKIYSLNNYIPTLWCDTAPSEKTESHRFVLRLLTQSHPWGYQRKNNSSVLSVSDRNKALEIFERNESMKGKGYTSYPSTSVFPYDSDLPIPLSFLLMSLEKENPDLISWKKNVIRLCKAYIPENIKTKSSKFNDKDGYIATIESVDFSKVFDAIKMVNEIEIHSNIVKKELISEEEDGNAENPTLFVRLNSSGTVLNGDELIYSIYKAFFPDSKELVEKIGLSFISAPHIISMVSRIAQTELTNGEFIGKMDMRTFQTRIKNIEFRNKLTELIGENENSQISLAFKKAVEVLKDEQELIMPTVLVKDLIKKNQEIFLLLVYWLFKNPTVELSNKLIKGILAKYTVLSWFGLDTPKYVREVWKSVKVEDFWTTKFSKEQSEKYITVLLPPQLLEKYYKNQLVIKEAKHVLNQDKIEGKLIIDETNAILDLIKKTYTGDIDELRINSIWWEFFRRLFWGRSLIVFAQRNYINNRFKDFNQIEDLQDTNVPWDWDHIYPDSWVYNQKDVKNAIRHWNNCIGNFRALSLGENRSENAYISPKVRLENLETKYNSFVKDSDFEFWSKIDDRIYSDEKVEFHTKAIVYRTLNIYREWWDKLMIDEILY